MMFSSQTHIHTLKRQDGHSLGFRHAHKPYIIGFPKTSMALRISKHTNHPSDIALTQHVTVNLLAQMTHAQKAYYKSLMANDNLEINFAGIITCRKHTMSIADMCTLVDVPLADFFTYPFTNNLGIAVPMKVLFDGRKEIVLEAVVVEANTRVEDFQARLEEG